MLLFYQSNKTGIFIVTKLLKKLKINGRSYIVEHQVKTILLHVLPPLYTH